MDTSKITKDQWSKINLMRLDASEIDQISAFDTFDYPLDAQGDYLFHHTYSDLCYPDTYTPPYSSYLDDNPNFAPVIPKESYVPCHTGTIHVFSHNGVNYHGGGSSRQMEYWSSAIILDLADNFSPSFELKNFVMPELDEELDCRIISVDWSDYSVPKLSKSFWTNLIIGLERISTEEGGDLDVIVCCVGGHGRTGTALSILSSLCNAVPLESCPVEWLRLNYCESAVESQSQIGYIEKITGLKVQAKLSKSFDWKSTPLYGGKK